MANKNQEIKVLNVAQPNAHNIIYGGKNVENRSSGCNFRGTIAIYASKTIGRHRFEDSDIKVEDCAFGAIIGFVDIVDCIVEEQVTKNTRKWFAGPYGYVFENVIPLKNPIQVVPPKGAVIWWPLTGLNLEKCLKQLGSRVIKPITYSEPNQIRPKTSGRSKLIPSAELAKIIGNEPLNFKRAFNGVVNYINEKNLYIPEDETIKADKVLKAVFRKQQIDEGDLKEIILNHLKSA